MSPQVCDAAAPPYKHRRTHGEVKRCKKGERTDIKLDEWAKFGYARSDILTRPIVYDSQTRPIPRVKRSDITPEWFFENVAKQHQPIIIEGGCSDWPAMKRWSIDALEARFKHISFKVGSDKKGKKLRMKMKYFADYMEQQQDDNPLYLFETEMNENLHMNKFSEDYAVPDLFPHDWLGLVNHDSRPPYRWFCIGPKRSGTTVHTDPLDTNAWNAVTHGCKRWVLFEPDVPKKVAKGKGFRNKGEDDEAVMYFDFILPRIKAAHPEVKVYEGLQNAGDVIFVPGAWWHGVLNMEDCVAVTQNYVGPENWESVWRRTRKDREKVASLWLRNMKKFAPSLYSSALEMNKRDKFKMRHERRPGEALSDKDSSSSESSSDSTSDTDGDLDPAGTAGALRPGVTVGRNLAKLPSWRDAVKTECSVAAMAPTPPTHSSGDADCAHVDFRRIASPMTDSTSTREDEPSRKRAKQIETQANSLTAPLTPPGLPEHVGMAGSLTPPGQPPA